MAPSAPLLLDDPRDDLLFQSLALHRDDVERQWSFGDLLRPADTGLGLGFDHRQMPVDAHQSGTQYPFAALSSPGVMIFGRFGPGRFIVADLSIRVAGALAASLVRRGSPTTGNATLPQRGNRLESGLGTGAACTHRPCSERATKAPLLQHMVFANVSRGEVGETSWRIGVAPVAPAVANGGRSLSGLSAR